MAEDAVLPHHVEVPFPALHRQHGLAVHQGIDGKDIALVQIPDIVAYPAQQQLLRAVPIQVPAGVTDLMVLPPVGGNDSGYQVWVIVRLLLEKGLLIPSQKGLIRIGLPGSSLGLRIHIDHSAGAADHQ